MREGSALLQGIATCGHCGRRLMSIIAAGTRRRVITAAGKDLVNGRGVYCLNVGGMVIEQAVANAFLEAITPAADRSHACSRSNNSKPTTMRLCRSGVWKWNAPAMRRNGPSAATGPWSRKTGWWLADWKPNGRIVCAIWPPPKWNCADASNNGPAPISPEQLQRIQMLGSDIRQVWTAPTTTDRDRKELLRTLLEEVILNLKRAEGRAHLTLRWRGGAIHDAGCPCPAIQADGAAHRRRYALAAAAPGRSLSR